MLWKFHVAPPSPCLLDGCASRARCTVYKAQPAECSARTFCVTSSEFGMSHAESLQIELVCFGNLWTRNVRIWEETPVTFIERSTLFLIFLFIIIIRPFCFSLTKPASFADCVGDELPMGWEQVLDPSRGVYYVNHGESKSEKESIIINFGEFLIVYNKHWRKAKLKLMIYRVPQKEFKSRIRGWSGGRCRRTCCASTWSPPRTTSPTSRSWSPSSSSGSASPRMSSSTLTPPWLLSLIQQQVVSIRKHFLF